MRLAQSSAAVQCTDVRSPQRISNRQHPIARRCQDVVRRRRADEDQVLLDGDHLLQEALGAGVMVEAVVTDGRPSAAVRAASEAGVPIYEAAPSILESISPVRTPTGVVSLARWRLTPVADVFSTAGLILGLVDVQDPGNLGAVIRAADALGASGVVALGQGADPAGWKALRGSMGSAFRLPIARATIDEALEAAARSRLSVVATVASGGKALKDVDLRQPHLVLLGHEGGGLDDALTARADLSVTIPMAAGVSSLNVAVAAGLVAYEARRQREATP